MENRVYKQGKQHRADNRIHNRINQMRAFSVRGLFWEGEDTMNRISAAVKKICHNRAVMISYLLMLVYLIVYFIRVVFFTTDLNSITDTDVTMTLLSLGRGIFIYFLIITYYFLCKNRTSEKDGKTGILAIFLLIFVEMLVHIIVAVLTFACVHKMYFEYFVRIIYSVLLYVTIPALIAACAAAVSAKMRNIWCATINIVAVYIVFGFDVVGNIVSIIPGISETHSGIWLSRLFYIFKTYNNITEYTDNYNPFIWASGQFLKVFGLLVLSAAVCAGYYIKKNGKIYAATGIIAAVILLYLSYMPENEYVVITSYRSGASTDSWNIDLNYYEGGKQALYENAAFDITDYDMTITAGRTTHFTVKMKFGDNSSDKYSFTLYHGYKVTSVTDLNGNKLSYNTDGDYIEVFTDGNSVEGMIMEYEGVSYVYMADGSHINYPEFFRYYPAAGKEAVFNVAVGDFVKKLSDKEASFHVKVNAEYKVYSNLTQISDNEFEGSTTGVLLLGGMCAGQTEYKGVNIVYPMLEYTRQEVEEDYDRIINVFNNHNIDITGKDWFVMSYRAGNYGCAYCGQDYMAGSFMEVYYDMPIDFGFQNWGE